MDRFRDVLADGAHEALPGRARPRHLRPGSGRGSGTPIGLPAGQSPAATTARRTGASSSASRSQPASPSACHGPQRQPVGVGLDRGDHRQPLGGQPVAVQPAALGQPRRSASSQAASSQPRARCSHSRVLRPAAAASTCARDAVDLALQPAPTLCPSPRCSRSVVSACQSARCGSVGHRQPRCWPPRAAGRAGRPRPPRPPASSAASAASAERGPLLAEHPADGGVDPGQPRVEGRRRGDGLPDRRHAAGDEGRREVVEGRRHHLGPDGAQRGRPEGEVARPEAASARPPRRRARHSSAK